MEESKPCGPTRFIFCQCGFTSDGFLIGKECLWQTILFASEQLPFVVYHGISFLFLQWSRNEKEGSFWTLFKGVEYLNASKSSLVRWSCGMNSLKRALVALSLGRQMIVSCRTVKCCQFLSQCCSEQSAWNHSPAWIIFETYCDV